MNRVLGGMAPQGSRCVTPCMRMNWGVSEILILIAVICFVLAAIGLDVNVSLVTVGLAFFAAAFLVPNRGIRTP